MALTRKQLRAMGIEDEKIDQIIEAHGETVSALKDERDGYREKAERLDTVERELEELKAKPDDGYREKYEKEHAEFEKFRADTERAATDREKSTLYRKLLTEAGIDPKRVDAIMRVTDLSEVTVEDGALKDAGKLAEKVKSDWSDFVVSTGTKPAGVDNPPAGNGGSTPEPKSLAEALRQKYNAD